MRNPTKRFAALALTLTMMGQLFTGMPVKAAGAEQTAASADHVLVNQVHGGSDDGHASHSSRELYHPTGEVGTRDGWSTQYRSGEDGPHNSVNVNIEEPKEQTFEAAETTGVQYTGYENNASSLNLTQIGRYNAKAMSEDGGSTEIVVYNDANGCAYVVNGLKGTLDCVDLDGLTSGSTVQELSGTEIDVKNLVNVDGFTYGDMTSVAVSPDGTTLAAAIQAENYADNGRVALFTCRADGSLTFMQAVEAGVQPDMVTFTPDGTKILTANEGEPRLGYGNEAVDPAGSVTVIAVDTCEAATVDFAAFDAKRAALVEKGIVLKKDTNPSVDLEPEYIACTNETAYISLQEANAIAVLDLSNNTFTGIHSVGFENYAETPIDLGNDDGGYAPQTYKNLLGIRMPDGIALYTVNGVDYLLTANEGDGRAWPEDTENDTNEKKDNDSPQGKPFKKEVTWFDAAQYDGLETNVDYLFGGRSFTMFQVTDSGLEEVFTSGSDFEAKTAQYLPDYFNCSNDNVKKEKRSGKKGPEPETVVVGNVNDQTYAFVTLERIGGIMVYNITKPTDVHYVNYINSRDFSEDIKDDVSAEGLKFIPAAQSPTGEAILLAACEVSGTMAAYELTATLPVAVISDVHLYDSSELGSSGAAFEAYLAADRKMLLESEAILDAALEQIAASDVKYLLIPGDLTKDGELVNHQLLAQKLAAFETKTGIQVFVTNGNHDISNAHAVRFEGDHETPVATVNTTEFRSIYAQFGYNEAVAKDSRSLSYAVDLGDDYRLIVMDSGNYNNDTTAPVQKTDGRFTESTMNWVLEQIEDAIRDGRRPVGMMHHGLVPHTGIQPTMFSEYLVQDYETVAATLADAGMNLVFTGHFHSQDVSKAKSSQDSVLYDVETGSLVTSPCPIRYVGLGKDVFAYTTDHVTEVESVDNFPEYANKFLVDGMNGLMKSMLPGVLMSQGIPQEQAAALGDVLAAAPLNQSRSITLTSLLVKAFVAHYAGDENIMEDPEVATIIQGLSTNSDLKSYVDAALSHSNVVLPEGAYEKIVTLLQTVTGALYTDFAPGDQNVAALALTELPEVNSGSTSSGGGSSSSGHKTESTTNPGGSTTTTVTKPDGSKTETTKAPNGSSSVVTTGKDGRVEANVTVSSSAVENAEGPVVLPMPEVFVTTDKSKAPTVTVDLPAGTTAKVEIPVAQVTPGTVAVLVKADGSEKVIKTSIATENGVAVELKDGDTVKIVDNSKDFVDVSDSYWGAEAVAFVSSRELFAGTSATTFSPDTAMNRAMIVTVLARFEGVDTTTGDTWYEAGQRWAVANGISDGTKMDQGLSREQLATMLWRYAGSPSSSMDMHGYTDAGTVSAYAKQAIAWAVEQGIIRGTSGTTLSPQGPATRAQVATILMRFVEYTMQ